MATVRSYLDAETSHFVVEGYNLAPPFSSFLPTIAGKWGIPIWCFLVNRGQAVASLGACDKDHQIVEFHSFNQACARIAHEGFRTFLRLGDKQIYEPFRRPTDARIAQTLTVTPSELRLRERNPALGLESEVAYFGLPNLRVAGLCRIVTLRNLRKKDVRFDWVDGLPRILPPGLDQQRIKGMPRRAESLTGVVERSGALVYRLKQEERQTEKTGILEGGHFYLRVGVEDARGLVADPDVVFGDPFSYVEAARFAEGGVRGISGATQYWENKTACAFSAQSSVLRAGEELELATIVGYAERDRDLDALMTRCRRPSFLQEKRQENQRTIDEIAHHAFSVSASKELDAHARQCFLDNVMRGGMPLTLDCRSGKSAIYVYARHDGDLERDDQPFAIEPTYLSQGRGSYPAFVESHRTDAWFFPETEDGNLRTFLGLIQLDGRNPYEIKPLSYRVVDRAQAEAWAERRIPSAREREELLAWMSAGFTPGALVMRLEDLIGLEPERRMATLDEVLSFSDENEIGVAGNGFWSEDWCENVALLQVLSMVQPDRIEELLLGRPTHSWFDNPEFVRPVAERARDVGGKIRSLDAVGWNVEKLERIRARTERPNTVRTSDGEIFKSSLFVKLLTIVVNRLATLDSEAIGVELEAGRAESNRSLHGLPSHFGSSLSETLALARTVALLRECLKQVRSGRGIGVYDELVEFMQALEPELSKLVGSRSQRANIQYWEQSRAIKRTYLAKTELGVSGAETRVPVKDVAGFLQTAAELLDRIFAGKTRSLAVSKSGVPHTYFVNDVTDYEPNGDTVQPLYFQHKPVKLFLDAPARWIEHRKSEAKSIYESVQKSALFDRKLKMYKTSESLRGESPELGRATGAYPRGWLANESIDLALQNRYLLALLRAGLCDEFWKDAKRALVPFMDPAVYGRSTLETASFVVSSAYADPSLHGRGFEPRLSGATVEFLEIWMIAAAGENPLRLDRQGRLELALEPRLPGWLFTTEPARRAYFDPREGWTELTIPASAYAFKLFGHTLVVYENPKRKDTWGRGGAQPRAYVLGYRNGKSARINAKTMPARVARAVRSGEVSRIDVELR